MLMSLAQPRSSPASSPSFRYAPASRSLPGSPFPRRDSKSRIPSPPPAQPVPQRVQYVDASTQWSPITSTRMELSRKENERATLGVKPLTTEATVSTLPAIETSLTRSPAKPILQPESPGMKRRQSQTSTTAATYTSPLVAPKRVKPGQAQVKILPARYEFCAVEDMVVLIANMINELIQTNDELPLRSGVLTRFHSRTPPGISVLDYLQRLAKHATLTPPLLLSMVYYIDRLCLLYPAFTITTLTVHRFLITAATVAAKGLSDSFWNNTTYARVGGIKIAELGMLELEFLYRVDWKIVPNPETLVEYYRALVARSEGYELEADSSSSDEDDALDEDSPELTEASDSRAEAETDIKWKAWMDDVSTQRDGSKAEDTHEDKPA